MAAGSSLWIFTLRSRSDESAMAATGPITIRGHTLLCLQGFRGKGYSPDFVENLVEINNALVQSSDTPVRVMAMPDDICLACPNLKMNGCNLKGPGFENLMRSQDRVVMSRLGIQEGETFSWHEILERIGQRMRGDMLPSICGDCPWLPLGYCQEGIEELRSGRKAMAPIDLKTVEKDWKGGGAV
jgi:uncharacterized protein